MTQRFGVVQTALRCDRIGYCDRNGEQRMQMLSEQDAAKVLKCSVACLRRWRREGRGPRWTKFGRMVRYSDSWLREFIEESVQARTGDARHA